MSRTLAAFVLALGACASPASVPPSPSPAPTTGPAIRASGDDHRAPTEAECARAFDPPPGATPLCDEHVLGTGMEIAWRSFATPGAPDETFAPYTRFASCAGFARRTGLSIGKGDMHLTVHAPTDRFPTCATKPPAGTGSVVLVSNAYTR